MHPAASSRSPPRRAAADHLGQRAALTDVAATKLRAHIGALTVLHTWGQTLVFHPHVHCVVPGGGFSLDGRRWVRLRRPAFLLAVKVLSRRFRTLVKNAITEAYAGGSLVRDRDAMGVGREIAEHLLGTTIASLARPALPPPTPRGSILSPRWHTASSN